MDWILAAVIAVLAFWMGYSVNQGGTCAVATANEISRGHPPRRFIGLFAASGVAALVAAPLAWLDVAGAALAPSIEVSATLLAGAMTFGFGAFINDACLLGSLGRLGDGEIRLALLPIGLALGFAAADVFSLAPGPKYEASVLAAPEETAFVALGAFAIVMSASLLFVAQVPAIRRKGQWRLTSAMIGLGATGGALFAVAPSWSYADFVHHSLPLATMSRSEATLLTVAATVAGAIAASHRRRRWRFRSPDARGVARTIIGGAFMGVGAALIPGGNDSLVLAAIPALSPGGIAAHIMMISIILFCLMFQLSVRRAFLAWKARRAT